LFYLDLSEDEVDSAITIFKEADADKSDTLECNEFKRLLRRLVPGVSDCLLEKLTDYHYKKAGLDVKTGSLSLEGFLHAYKDIYDNETRHLALLLAPEFPDWTVEKIEEALHEFEKFDIDNSGVLDKDEFYQLKESLVGSSLSKLILRRHTEKAFKQVAEQEGQQKGISQLDFLKSYHEILSKDIRQSDFKASTDNETGRLFTAFVDASTFEESLRTFGALKESCNAEKDCNLFELLKDETSDNVRAKVLWTLLTKRMKQPEYKCNNMDKCRVLVAGAGPAGLRTAIESAMLGAHVVVLEKRRKFSRNNLLHLWPSSIRDFKNIGAKYFYGKFCTGGINHIAIRQLQLLLTKIALILGVKILHMTSLVGIGEPAYEEKSNCYMWTAKVDSELENLAPELLKYNVLVGGDGEGSRVAQFAEFERKIFQGSRAIGITCNFVNTKTKPEQDIREFGILAIYDQKFFKELKDKYEIELENLVYYRGETHYFVMTAKKSTLLARGVCRENLADDQGLLSSANVDRVQLEELVRVVATHVGLPETCKFSLASKGGFNDVAVFDFSKKKQAKQPFLVLDVKDPKQGCAIHPCLPVSLVGDALIEPFWPKGTGANRAVLSALDTAYMIKEFFDMKEKEPQKVLNNAARFYRVLVAAEPADLQSSFSMHTIDPSSRYKTSTHSHFH